MNIISISSRLLLILLFILSFGLIRDVTTMPLSSRHLLLQNTERYSSIDRVPLILSSGIASSSSSSSSSSSKSLTSSSSSSSLGRDEYVAGEVTILKPKGWLRRAVRGARIQQKRQRDLVKSLPLKVYDENYIDDEDGYDDNKVGITDVVYLPPLLSTHAFDMTMCHGGDDDHMSSIMCEEGYNVHIISLDVHYSNVATQIYALDRVMKMLIPSRTVSSSAPPSEPSVCARNVAIISSELSCVSTLRYLTEIALPFTIRASSSAEDAPYIQERFDVGAVVLMDPPPMSSLYSTIGRRKLLDRYTKALQNEDNFRSVLEQSSKLYQRDEIRALYGEYTDWYDMSRTGKACRCLTALIKNDETVCEDGNEERGEEVDYMKELKLMETEVSKSRDYNDYDYEYLASRQKKKRKRNGSLAHPVYTKYGTSTVNGQGSNNENAHDQANDGSIDELVDDLVGMFPPRNLYGLGNAMKDRILVIDTDRVPHDDGDESHFSFDDVYEDVSDHWGPVAMEEVAKVCNALPLISISDDDHECDINDEVDKGCNDINAHTHHCVAKKITDWFTLLQRYDFL